ncbi:hypothetical protein CLAFUW4_09903 [Fulvia fulva]|uniref:Serine-threonine protein kinase 19-domain-containing protein n=1 Tax=Passalora fulva TaxID=5499 RepID=A0A9Q8PIB9_PASFU|nr:uncharacterized protein CLAFUR5_12337 [Fulvia fulva]KAK4616135.1 hypothetical protein CLAFUR4_09908 [Fulvia fulva]KAK4617258.1 hypothetical protein CLAFUR0_09902 [Fulvia fulva]UJO23174.1 hypothetical protein CLAFUR5_12337 [Fulvia fulva]WPV18984.1 hypothetical protein CLAFUW4_09903 [Fulvia fulva]WPV33677.1 hypothetical protein CLAFUW7_09905 [Fulvia fulva]
MPKTVNPLLRRKSSSPFTTAQRTKPGSRKSSLKDDATERLDDVGGRRPSLASANTPQDVVKLIRYIRDASFEDVPDRAAGMNSEQISATLRFRASLPPVVSVAHLHALSVSTTNTERELARLIAMGKIRKVIIPGRGKGGSAVGEGVAVVEDWESRLQEESALEDEVKHKYMALMATHPASPTAPVTSLTDAEVRSLVTAGYLTNPAAITSSLSDLFARPSGAPSGSISQAGFKSATGSLAAVGGYGAIQDSGGGGSMLATKDTRPSNLKAQREMTFSLPNTGAYLKLLTEARLHLLFLLKQLSPRYKEATKAFLEEKWNGNVPNDAISQQKRMRGEWSGVLPGKTKRWREFYGVEFEWVLAECVGSGLVELFETGSVGVGVRAI